MSDRIEQLEKFAMDEPDDPFNWYALALEYQKVDVYKALLLFKKLVAEHREYVPTYYHFGKLLIEQDQREAAKAAFELGIDIARASGDRKALRELQSAYQEAFDEQ